MQPGRRLTHRSSLVAQGAGVYDAGPSKPPAVVRELIDATAASDRALARAIRLMIRAQSTGEVEAESGLPVDAWLAQLGRVVRVDRTFLAAAADVLSAMPATLTCFSDGTLSWSQVRAIVGAVRPLRIAQRAELDEEIAAAAHEFTTWDPEQIVWRVDLLAAELLCTPDTDDVGDLLEEPDRPADSLVLQPRLDGYGGKLWGDYHDPVAFGIVENALSEHMGRPGSLEPSVDDAARRRNADRLGQARAEALVDLCRDSLAGTKGDATAAKPLLLVTTTLDSLLGLTQTPGQLLTRMTGGTMKVDAATLRRLVNEGGAALRTIVIDETGQALGVGRRTYVPPAWLRETMLALQHECGTPGCRTAARLCDLDHVEPWPDGGTDLNNFQFQCRRNHVEKTKGDWQVQVLPDGTRRHRHTRSGLTTDVPLSTRPLATPALQPPRCR